MYLDFHVHLGQQVCDTLGKTRDDMETIPYETHDAIRIIGEDDSTMENGVTGGNGTLENPYIIEHWDIKATSFWLRLDAFLHWLEQTRFDSIFEYFVNIPVCGIYLKDTAKHVIIRNNSISDWNSGQRELLRIAGIIIVNASNVTIERNYFENNYAGVSFANVQRVTMRVGNSTRTFHEEYESVFCDIRNNTFVNSEFAGIDLDFTSRSEIIGNVFLENGFGIRSNLCTVLITNNSFLGNGNGLLCSRHDHSTILNNTFFRNGNGIYCSNPSSDPDGSDPLIDGNHFEENLAGIFIRTMHPKISNNTFYRNDLGIMNMGASQQPVLIIDNVIRENICYGIEFEGPCIIEHNLIIDNVENGLKVRGNATIKNNVIASNNERGLLIGLRSNQKTAPSIHYNNIFDNGGQGMYLLSSIVDLPVNATYNYWGSSDGPSGHGSGSGDEIVEGILFQPWLSEPNTLAGPRP